MGGTRFLSAWVYTMNSVPIPKIFPVKKLNANFLKLLNGSLGQVAKCQTLDPYESLRG